MNLIPLLLTTTAAAAPDAMISGDWIIKAIGAICAGAALVLGRYWGRKEAAGMRLESPVPTVPTSKVSTPPSWDAHRALCDRVSRTESDILRVEGELKEMRIIQTQQFQTLMHAGAEREERIGTKIDGFAKAVHSRIDEILTKRPAR
jgi:hypothetical protein